MLGISTDKLGYIIHKAREWDVKTEPWEDPNPHGVNEYDANAILEDISEDATRAELAEFIRGLNEDEQARLVALVWIGRGTYAPEEFAEAIRMAKAENVNPAEDYLLGIPLLPDFLEEGLDRMGVSLEDD